MVDFDAVVVGGGPAGSTAARELAASGVRVLLLDRAAFPRYKACGGGIPLRTQRMFAFPIDAVVEDSVNLLEVTLRGRTGFVRDSGTPFAHMVMRDRFDALLLDHARVAGAEVRQRTTVRSIETGPTEVRVRGEEGFTASASFVIAADGATTPCGRSAGLGGGMAECAAWEVELERPANAERWRSRALIDVGYSPWGYAWLFPKAQHLSVGIVLPPARARELRGRVRGLVERLGLEGSAGTISRGHKIRFRRGGEPIASDRVALAGDAAGLADEFTEEGIAYAVQSGRLAARAVTRALGGAGSLRGYEADVDREIMPELAAARLIGRAFYAGLGHGGRAWFTAARFMPGIWPAFFAVQRGESTYAREVRRFQLHRLVRGHRLP